ncbi:16S rRNA (cytosine(1402)-N(4))-methyltransferase RsmH [Curvivirga sp.]|uniref:16S rRNA (cytosine(1402)-N(4))-methyltransferase RsmH n=1 Tax=Curvivirga sp. TaxID=2856848 RepID=UPI003B5A26D1
MSVQQVHYPVMLREVVQYMEPKAGEVYLDGTFGAGGYSRAILETADCTLYAVDRDPTAHKRAEPIVKEFDGRLKMLLGCFGDMQDLLAEKGIKQLDGIVLDLGVSSPQLDVAERGFSFREDGPLDMRMGDTGPTAADIVNTWEWREMARIFSDYGEERHAGRVARAIEKARQDSPIETTLQLADIVRSVVRKANDGIDPATRTFQGLRIEVNDELGELDRALLAAEALLAPNGRLVVVSFHSLEDRRVKQFLRDRNKVSGSGTNRYLPIDESKLKQPSFNVLTKRALPPQDDEIKENPRSRSSKLRAAIRTDADAWGEIK